MIQLPYMRFDGSLAQEMVKELQTRVTKLDAALWTGRLACFESLVTNGAARAFCLR
jgi:hypothetical protein